MNYHVREVEAKKAHHKTTDRHAAMRLARKYSAEGGQWMVFEFPDGRVSMPRMCARYVRGLRVKEA